MLKMWWITLQLKSLSQQQINIKNYISIQITFTRKNQCLLTIYLQLPSKRSNHQLSITLNNPPNSLLKLLIKNKKLNNWSIRQRIYLSLRGNQFSTLNSTIDLDLSKNKFNLIQYEKEDDKIKYDPQIMTAKLRRLENQAEINRIEMELQIRRKKKKHNSHLKPLPNQYQNKTYKKTFQEFKKNSTLLDIPPNDSDSEEQEIKDKPKGISRFSQLKKHSRILQFTLKKISEKEENSLKEFKQKLQRKENAKTITNELRDYGEYSQAATKIMSKTINALTKQYNPQIIIEDKFKRIMTMKAKDRVSQETKQNPRCNKMMNIQNDILLELQHEKKNLSKDNMKKLKSRFIEIVNEIEKGDRKRKQNRFLPSINLLAFTAREKGQKQKRIDKRQQIETARQSALNYYTIESKEVYSRQVRHNGKDKESDNDSNCGLQVTHFSSFIQATSSKLTQKNDEQEQ